MKQKLTFATVLLCTGLAGCANLSDTEQRTMTGAAAGAAAGVLIGDSTKSTLIGAGVGAVGGYLWDQHKKTEQRAYEQGKRDAEKEANSKAK